MKNMIIFLILFTYIVTNDYLQLKEEIDSLCQDPDHKHYDKITLAYITPWNSKGIDLTLKYYNKFDIISPCWFDIKPEVYGGKFNSKIDGSNYVNSDYMDEMKEKKNSVKFMPRFICSEFTIESYKMWLEEENMNHFLKILFRRLKHNSFDGIVLECNHLWLIEELYPKYSLMISKISEMFKKEKLSLIVTLFPYSESFQNQLNKAKFEYLSKYVDYFNIMSYDYLSHIKAKKNNFYNAPLSWINKTLQYYIDMKKSNKDELLKKVLLGLPFHGILAEEENYEKAQILDVNTMSALLSSTEENQINWDNTECESKIKIINDKKNLIASYPTKKFLRERLNLSKELKLGGVGLWDISQGPESFLDEF